MTAKYSNKDYEKDHMARALGRSLPISTKASVEICNNIRHKSLARAKQILNEAIALKTPIKYTRFTNGAGHKKGMGAGKYPQKAAGEILKMLLSVEANAQFKGINTSNLIINHISANNAGNTWRYGRHRRRKMKRTNIEVILEETKKKPKTDVAPSKTPVGKPAEAKIEDVSKTVKPAASKKPVVEEAAKPVAPKKTAVKEPVKKAVPDNKEPKEAKE